MSPRLPEGAASSWLSAGLRILFPQLNRLPFRFDGGVPLEGDHSPVPSLGGTQAVPLTAFEDEQAL